MNARVGQKPIEWPAEGQNMYNSEQLPHIDVRLYTMSYSCTYHLHFGYRIRLVGHENIPALGSMRSNYTVNYLKPLVKNLLVSNRF